MISADTALVRRLQAQDPAALVELRALYRGRIYVLAFRFLRNHQDAEEVTQDVLLVVWRKIGLFRAEASLQTWLLCIARNQASNYWHYKRRRAHITDLSLDLSTGIDGVGTLANVVAAEEPSVPRRAEMAEFNSQVTELFPQLTYKERQIMLLCLEGKNYKQMVAITGLEFGTVKSRLSRARHKLRALLEHRDPALCDLRPERVA